MISIIRSLPSHYKPRMYIIGEDDILSEQKVKAFEQQERPGEEDSNASLSFSSAIIRLFVISIPFGRFLVLEKLDSLT